MQYSVVLDLAASWYIFFLNNANAYFHDMYSTYSSSVPPEGSMSGKKEVKPAFGKSCPELLPRRHL